MYTIIDEAGNKRIAGVLDFQDVTITFTPVEWQELQAMFEYRRKTFPSPLAKTQRTIYKKIMENEPKLKDGLTVIHDSRKEKEQ